MPTVQIVTMIQKTGLNIDESEVLVCPVHSRETRLVSFETRRVSRDGGNLWLAEWCKIHKVHIHSHSMLFLVFTNIFIHIQQLSFYSRNIFIYI